jgi:azurin
VHPGGSAAGGALPEVIAARKARRPVLVLQVFQTGAAVAPRKRTHNHWLTFNVSDDQARIHDIVAGLATLPAGSGADVLATGDARYWAAVAVAASGGGHRLTFDATSLAADDAAMDTACFVPGIQRVGGMRTVSRLLSSGS